MIVAIWIIAVCEVIRAVQNHIQLMALKHSRKNSDTATQAFVDSLKKTDREFVMDTLKEIEKANHAEE